MSRICANESCGHPTDKQAWMWAPGQLSAPLCICCMRAIWEDTLANVKKALEDYPAVTPEECAAGVGLLVLEEAP